MGYKISTEVEIVFETADYDNNIISLTRPAWFHILDGRGTEFVNFLDDIQKTVEKPDYIGSDKKNKDCKVYIKEDSGDRRFSARYLLVFVNENGNITSSRFDTKINFPNQKKIKYKL